MEAQLQRPSHDQYQLYEQAPHDTTGLHSVIGGEGDQGEHNHPGEKKSVLKKVKDKAKKIKDTIKKHGQGHEHDYRHDQISEEEEDDDDEVHGAPMYDQSSVIPGTNLPIQSDAVNLEKPTDTREDRYNPNVIRNEVSKMEIDFERPSVEARRPDFESLPESKPDATFMEEAKVAEPMVQINPLMGLEEDPHFPKSHPAKIPPSNYQAKVADPTGHDGKEADVAPLLERLDNFHIHDKSQSNPVSEQKPHDQIAPQSTPTVDQLTPESNPVNPSKIPESSERFDQAKLDSTPRDTVAGKISSATSAIAGKAVSAKDMVADVTQMATDYGHKVAEKLAGAGSAVMSSVQRGGGDTAAERGSDRGVSVREYLAEKLRPGEEDKALSEAITGRFYKKKEGMKPAGRVMEAEVAAARFGTAKEASGGSTERSAGGGVVDRLKGAVGSWLGKSSGIGLSDGSVPVVKEEIESQPRVQGSSN